MNTRIVSAAVLLGAFSSAPVLRCRRSSTIGSRKAMPSKYTPPVCGLKAGHFKVQQRRHLPEDRHRDRGAGQPGTGARQRSEGATRGAGAKPAGQEPGRAGTISGESYLQQGDLAGADTHSPRPRRCRPGARRTSAMHATAGWVPLVNAGINFTKEQKNDSALALFRQANTIYRDKPHRLPNAGVIFANSRQDDSAIVYFQKASEIAERTNSVEDRNVATRNLGCAASAGRPHRGSHTPSWRSMSPGFPRTWR